MVKAASKEEAGSLFFRKIIGLAALHMEGKLDQLKIPLVKPNSDAEGFCRDNGHECVLVPQPIDCAKRAIPPAAPTLWELQGNDDDDEFVFDFHRVFETSSSLTRTHALIPI